MLYFPECHIVGIIQCVAFSGRFLSLSNVQKFHGLTILLLSNIPLPGYTTVDLSIHLTMDILILGIVNKATISMHVLVWG